MMAVRENQYDPDSLQVHIEEQALLEALKGLSPAVTDKEIAAFKDFKKICAI